MYAIYRGKHMVTAGLSYRAALRYTSKHRGTRMVPWDHNE